MKVRSLGVFESFGGFGRAVSLVRVAEVGLVDSGCTGKSGKRCYRVSRDLESGCRARGRDETKRMRKTNRQTDRLTDRHRDKDTGTRTDRDRQTDRGRKTDRDTDR